MKHVVAESEKPYKESFEVEIDIINNLQNVEIKTVAKEVGVVASVLEEPIEVLPVLRVNPRLTIQHEYNYNLDYWFYFRICNAVFFIFIIITLYLII